MGKIRGQREYEKWKKGDRLSVNWAVLAQCYSCNGFEESADDCKGESSCPLYRYSPHGRRRCMHKMRSLNPRAEKGSCMVFKTKQTGGIK